MIDLTQKPAPSAGSFPTIDDSLGRAALSPRYEGEGRNNLRLRRAIRDVQLGARSGLRILAIGDSLATANWLTVNAQLEPVLAGQLASSTWYGRTGTTSGGVIGELNGGATATRVEKTDYAYSWLGITTRHTSGAPRSIWGVGNGAPWADRIIIPIYRESGAGSIRIEIAPGDNGAIPAAGSGLWRDPAVGEVTVGPALTGGQLIYDAGNVTAALYCIVLTVALGQWAVRITHSSGSTVRTMDLMFEVASASAINSYRIAAGSNNFAATNSAATPLMAEFIRVYDPDLIVIESDDSTAAYQVFLPQLDAALTASTLTSVPLVLLVGNPGIGDGFGTSQTDLAARINYCWEYALPRRWDVIDGLALAQGIASLTAVGWNADNVHLNSDIWREMARWWALQRGYMRVVERRPGGDIAARLDIGALSSDRYVSAKDLLMALALPSRIDTGLLPWALTKTGNTFLASVTDGSGAPGGTTNAVAAGYRLSTYYGTTSNGAAYLLTNSVDVGGTLVAHDNSAISLGRRFAMGMRLRLPHVWTANAIAYIGVFADGRASNAGYTGAHTGHGFSFRITNGGILHGVAWNGSAMVATSTSLNLSLGGTADPHELHIVTTPSAINASTGSVEFFVSRGPSNPGLISLGSLNYSQSGSGFLRMEITAGGIEGQNTIDHMRPVVVLAP